MVHLGGKGVPLKASVVVVQAVVSPAGGQGACVWVINPVVCSSFTYAYFL